MARQNGLFSFEGTLDNVTFYKTEDGLLVRKKASVNKQRFMKDSAYARVRENAAEFGNCAKSAGMLRKSVALLANKAKDSKLSSRLIKILFGIMKMDLLSNRGERSVGKGLLTPSGKVSLKGFDFNRNAKWHTIVTMPYALDTLTGTLTFTDFNPTEHLNLPDGATHFSLQSAYLHLDLLTDAFEILYSDVFNYPISNGSLTSVLAPSGVPTGGGCKIYFVLISFFQEVNGLQYALHNGAFNALTITEVL